MLPPAARPTTRSASRKASTTARVLRPTEPVLPRMETLRIVRRWLLAVGRGNRRTANGQRPTANGQRQADMILNVRKSCKIKNQYEYRIGAVKKIESKRSRKPPWPGISVPESFTAAERFHIDSARSPMTPAADSTAPPITACSSGSSLKNVTCTTTAVMIETAMPPASPSKVFLGLMRGDILCLPSDLPT